MNDSVSEPNVIYEDEEILVLNKPAGITVNRSETTRGDITVQDWVEQYLKIPSTKSEIRNKSKIINPNDQNNFEFRDSGFEFLNRAGIVHRIDKETSGILLVAKTKEAFIDLQAQFKERKVKKTYLALAHGKIESEEGEIRVPVGRLPWNRKKFGVVADGREAVTKYKVLSIKHSVFDKKGEPLTLLELYPETGRTHQIRVHLKYINHPIFSDFLYAGRKISRNDRKILNRVFLHAHEISFYHPKSKKLVSFESNLPEELLSVINKLE
ncbi:MAG: RluA family pseudouridine synthase [bacterium]|nr:RluA family pseudouridine synthase [bacterium]